jgi:Ca2+-binding EF-hand superfamily protein
MSSSIGSIGSNITTMMMQGKQGMKRPDPAQMADNLFSKLDTSGQGYIQKSDLQTAFDKISSTSSSSSDSSSSVNELFSQLDTNGDNKVTKQEFSDSLKKMAEQFESAVMNQHRNEGMQSGGMRGMPPGGMMPPGGGDSAGLTKDQLTSLSNDIGSSDSTASSKISNLIENFDKADTDQDGKVSMQEAKAFDQASSSSSADSSTDVSAATSSANLEKKLMQQIAQLMQAYVVGADQNSNGLQSTLSISA